MSACHDYVIFTADGLPPLPGGKVYELWLMAPQSKVWHEHRSTSRVEVGMAVVPVRDHLPRRGGAIAEVPRERERVAFGVDDGYVPPAGQPGRLMFCGSPRRYEPRWFRSPPMAGVKDEGAACQNYQNYVAQAPDGLFLICFAHDGIMSWVRADT